VVFRSFCLRYHVATWLSRLIGAAFGTLITAILPRLHHAAARSDRGKPNFSVCIFTVHRARFGYGTSINVLIAFGSWPPSSLLRRGSHQPSWSAYKPTAESRPPPSTARVPSSNPGGRPQCASARHPSQPPAPGCESPGF